MVQPQPESQRLAATDAGANVNAEAIPPEQPNAASPQPASPIRHEARPAGTGGLLMLLVLLAVLGIGIIYAVWARAQ